jgi:hypothetical protein
MGLRLIELDRVTIVAPLGLQFHDAATGTIVGDGLSVWAFPAGRPAARRQLIANRVGVYVLHHADGLIDLEHGAGDESYWQNLPPTKPFVIEVNDEYARFQPFQLTIDLPTKDIYKWNGTSNSSPLSSMTSIPLYSSPARSLFGGMAVVRAELHDPLRAGPLLTAAEGNAAATVLELYDEDLLVARGFADELGRLALIFPYPSPRTFPPGSPPGSPLSSPPMATGPALTDQVWNLKVRAFYSPPLSSPLDPFTEDSLPDLKSTLAQPEAQLWADADRTETLSEVALQYGRELILKSRSPSASPLDESWESVLFITPAASPP